MNITVNIDEEKLTREVNARLSRESWINSTVERIIREEAQQQINSLPVRRIVHDYLESRIGEILDDVVNRQIRHVVKLAVDKELAAARESATTEDVK